MKTFRLFIAVTLISFTLSPRTQAVNPPPDGGYADNNTAEGTNALVTLIDGADNTAIGFNALFASAF